jgi:hypothetical protein
MTIDTFLDAIIDECVDTKLRPNVRGAMSGTKYTIALKQAFAPLYK